MNQRPCNRWMAANDATASAAGFFDADLDARFCLRTARFELRCEVYPSRPSAFFMLSAWMMKKVEGHTTVREGAHHCGGVGTPL